MSTESPSRSALLLVAIAGLFGATGTAVGAVAAHSIPDPALATAGTFLLIHAAALPGLAAGAHAFRAGWRLLAPGVLIALGVALFSGAIVARAGFGVSPIPMMAPAGGSLLILGWVAAALGALLSLTRRP
ncbi:hypothetical protein GCM10008171_13020 [Methylopila jiangsuensis]|uniref:DUF423 domain-containing protein n=1 Tax=Methylopila jiangsuensis TaxID=586230 RepID=A0A9W6N389_9HYPH|nr:DUF423 domain-containing protein [Methylopila jiangsuensis]MDR6286285.1 uncharacterized membrane protein YgdD (TMEM256/DUF423 family) [Methylopila jiangsuensis]GLK76048.1 hypothetical protein GCM10008171_13020 [Methylopila jiangsuensis]